MNSPPFISVVIPTFERPDSLQRCLGAVAAQDYPARQYEVIVVDDGGTVPLREIVERCGLDVRLIRQGNSGCAAARNTGARCARGSLLAFADDDCRPDAGWLAALAEAHLASPQALIGCTVRNGVPENRFSEATQVLLNAVYEYDGKKRPRWRFFSGNSLAAPTEDFLSQGGFESSLDLSCAEDRELCNRWFSSGRPLHFSENAVVWHDKDLNFLQFCGQHFKYGRGSALYSDLRTKSQRMPAPGPSFFLDLIKRSGFRMDQTALLMLSQCATAAGVLFQTLATQRKQRPRVQRPG